MLNFISYDVPYDDMRVLLTLISYDENAGLFRQMAFPTCISRSKIKKCLFKTPPHAFAKTHDKSCFLAASQLILLIHGEVALFEPPYE